MSTAHSQTRDTQPQQQQSASAHNSTPPAVDSSLSSSSSSSSQAASLPVRTRKRSREMPPPPPSASPPCEEGTVDIAPVPYDASAVPSFKSQAWQQKIAAFTGASETQHASDCVETQHEDSSSSSHADRAVPSLPVFLPLSPPQPVSRSQADHQLGAVSQVPAYSAGMSAQQQCTAATLSTQSSPILLALLTYPRKRYCDVTHFPAQYTDPTTRLHFLDASVFAIVRSMGRDELNARLALRRAQLSEIK